MPQARNTPLSPRSLVLSLLLGMRRPARPGRELVAWCGLFGVAEGSARVALTRMVRAGELENHDGVYGLAGRVGGRATEHEFAAAPRFVDAAGEWTMYLVSAEARAAAERAALRTALRHLRFAERREGVWMRPANLDQTVDPVVQGQCERYAVRPESPRALADDLFRPSEWATPARALVDELRVATRALPDPGAIPSAFLAGTRAVAHLRADPLLPPELVPARWPGDRLRDTYGTYQRAFAGAVRDWFAAQ